MITSIEKATGQKKQRALSSSLKQYILDSAMASNREFLPGSPQASSKNGQYDLSQPKASRVERLAFIAEHTGMTMTLLAQLAPQNLQLLEEAAVLAFIAKTDFTKVSKIGSEIENIDAAQANVLGVRKFLSMSTEATTDRPTVESRDKKPRNQETKRPTITTRAEEQRLSEGRSVSIYRDHPIDAASYSEALRAERRKSSNSNQTNELNFNHKRAAQNVETGLTNAVKMKSKEGTFVPENATTMVERTASEQKPDCPAKNASDFMKQSQELIKREALPLPSPEDITRTAGESSLYENGLVRNAEEERREESYQSRGSRPLEARYESRFDSKGCQDNFEDKQRLAASPDVLERRAKRFGVVAEDRSNQTNQHSSSRRRSAFLSSGRSAFDSSTPTKDDRSESPSPDYQGRNTDLSAEWQRNVAPEDVANHWRSGEDLSEPSLDCSGDFEGLVGYVIQLPNGLLGKKLIRMVKIYIGANIENVRSLRKRNEPRSSVGYSAALFRCQSQKDMQLIVANNYVCVDPLRAQIKFGDVSLPVLATAVCKGKTVEALTDSVLCDEVLEDIPFSSYRRLSWKVSLNTGKRIKTASMVFQNFYDFLSATRQCAQYPGLILYNSLKLAKAITVPLSEDESRNKASDFLPRRLLPRNSIDGDF